MSDWQLTRRNVSGVLKRWDLQQPRVVDASEPRCRRHDSGLFARRSHMVEHPTGVLLLPQASTLAEPSPSGLCCYMPEDGSIVRHGRTYGGLIAATMAALLLHIAVLIGFLGRFHSIIQPKARGMRILVDL